MCVKKRWTTIKRWKWKEKKLFGFTTSHDLCRAHFSGLFQLGLFYYLKFAGQFSGNWLSHQLWRKFSRYNNLRNSLFILKFTILLLNHNNNNKSRIKIIIVIQKWILIRKLRTGSGSLDDSSCIVSPRTDDSCVTIPTLKQVRSCYFYLDKLFFHVNSLKSTLFAYFIPY